MNEKRDYFREIIDYGNITYEHIREDILYEDDILKIWTERNFTLGCECLKIKKGIFIMNYPIDYKIKFSDFSINNPLF